MVYFKNTSAAFIIAKSKAEMLLGRDDMVVNGQNVFHVINFNIERKLK